MIVELVNLIYIREAWREKNKDETKSYSSYTINKSDCDFLLAL